MGPVGDATIGAIEYALRGLAQRAELSSHNVANVNTPGFRARSVEFESALTAALQTGTIDDRIAAPMVSYGNGFPDATGNTVDLETEMVSMMKDNLLQNAMVQAHNFKTTVLRTAITGR